MVYTTIGLYGIGVGWLACLALRAPSIATLIPAVLSVVSTVYSSYQDYRRQLGFGDWVLGIASLVVPVCFYWLKRDRVQALACFVAFAMGCATLPGPTPGEPDLVRRTLQLIGGLAHALAIYRIGDGRPRGPAEAPWEPRSTSLVVLDLMSVSLLWVASFLAAGYIGSAPLSHADSLNVLHVALLLVIAATVFQQGLGIFEGRFRPSTTSPWATTGLTMALFMVPFEFFMVDLVTGLPFSGSLALWIAGFGMAIVAALRLMHLGRLTTEAAWRGRSDARRHLLRWGALDLLPTLAFCPLILLARDSPERLVPFVILSLSAALSLLTRLRIRRLELALATTSLADEFGPSSEPAPLPAASDPA